MKYFKVLILFSLVRMKSFLCLSHNGDNEDDIIHPNFSEINFELRGVSYGPPDAFFIPPWGGGLRTVFAKVYAKDILISGTPGLTVSPAIPIMVSLSYFL